MEFPTWKDWLMKQEKIYNEFGCARTLIKTDGLSGDPIVTECKGGKLITFRPPESLAQKIADVSQAIQKLVPGTITYGAERMHTTISVRTQGTAFTR